MAPSIPQHDVYSTGDNCYGQLFGKPSIIENEFVINNGLKTTLKNEKFITQIDAGDDFTAFLTHDNSLFLAGYNANNIFGLEVTSQKIRKQENNYNQGHYANNSSIADYIVDEPTIVPPKKFNNEEITHLSCGSNHICVVTNRTDIYVCGLLGNGFVKVVADMFPKEYKKSATLEHNFISLVGSGLNFSVFVVNMRDVYLFSNVLQAYLSVQSWRGKMGGSESFFPKKKQLVYQPRQQFKDDCIISLACGKSHFMVLTDKNEIYGMGSNHEGQLGETVENEYRTFVKIKLPEPNLKISSIQCGSIFSAVCAGNKLYMSGSNQYGQLGLGYKARFKEFTEVTTIYEDFKISCGRNHSIIHLLKSNQVLVSGFNGESQLGMGRGVPNVRTFKLLEMKFDKKIAHVLCGRASSVSIFIVAEEWNIQFTFAQSLRLL